MTHPRAGDGQIAFFREHGWLVVEDAIPAAELAEVDARCHVILEKKEKLAFDWAWEQGRTLEEATLDEMEAEWQRVKSMGD